MIRQFELVERVKTYDPNVNEEAINRAIDPEEEEEEKATDGVEVDTTTEGEIAQDLIETAEES